MNIFYAPPEQINETVVELSGQEANHASKTLRYRRGDEITVVDGIGSWYEGTISQISPRKVRIEINNVQQKQQKKPVVTLAMGIIKKRDRLEFGVEKAVELGTSEIALFRGDHSIKQNIRMDRLESIAISAMKQSLQAWLPEIKMFGSMHQMLQKFSDHQLLAAHESGDRFSTLEADQIDTDYLIVVGPEGDFSDSEIQLFKENAVQFVSLSPNRLRTETAAINFLSIM